MGTGTSTQRRTLALAIVIVVGLLVPGFLLGFIAVDGSWARSLASAAPSEPPPFSRIVTEILLRNLGAAALLYSGVITGGLSSVSSLVLVAIYVGVSARVGTEVSGGMALVYQTGAYAPLEFLGLGCTAVAGIVPAVHTAVHHRSGKGRRKRTSLRSVFGTYLDAAPRSLSVFMIGVALIIMAAVVEAAVIVGRGAG